MLTGKLFLTSIVVDKLLTIVALHHVIGPGTNTATTNTCSSPLTSNWAFCFLLNATTLNNQ